MKIEKSREIRGKYEVSFGNYNESIKCDKCEDNYVLKSVQPLYDRTDLYYKCKCGAIIDVFLWDFGHVEEYKK